MHAIRGALTAAALFALALTGAVPSQAHHDAPNGAGAEAYGLLVDARLLPAHVPVQQGPLAWANQDHPPGAAQPDEAQMIGQGPIPADGSLVGNIGILSSIAGANGTPQAVASAEAIDVNLLGGRVTADVMRAQANADCANNPNANGTTFVNLKINGTPIDATPAPNTVIDLQVAKVILNEQRPAFDGRGIVVNAVHIISTTTGDPLFRGDIIVSHAMSTVHCHNGPGSTGESNVIRIVKNASPTSTTPGGEITYTATVSNHAAQPCLVTRVVDHLPPGFSPVATSGDLGGAFEADNRPGGGIDVSLGNGVTIAAGGSATQTFVVKVADSTAPGTYWNNVEVFCANLGDFIKGLDAPVTVTAAQVATTTTTTTPAVIDAAGELPQTGGAWPGPATVLVLGVAAALAYRAAAASKRSL